MIVVLYLLATKVIIWYLFMNMEKHGESGLALEQISGLALPPLLTASSWLLLEIIMKLVDHISTHLLTVVIRGQSRPA